MGVKGVGWWENQRVGDGSVGVVRVKGVGVVGSRGRGWGVKG